MFYDRIHSLYQFPLALVVLFSKIQKEKEYLIKLRTRT